MKQPCLLKENRDGGCVELYDVVLTDISGTGRKAYSSIREIFPEEELPLVVDSVSDEAVVARCVRLNEASHIRKILEKSGSPSEIRMAERTDEDCTQARELLKKNIVLLESMQQKNTGEYRASALDWFYVFSLLAVFILLCVNVGQTASRSATEIHRAVIKNDVNKVRRMVDRRPELVLARDGEGRTPLHYVSGPHAFELAEILLASGADVNVTDKYGRTPMYYVYVKDDKQTLYLFLREGAVFRERQKERSVYAK